MRARHKSWTTPYLAEHEDKALPVVDPNSEFFKSKPLYLEIGMGKGDFILGLSKIQKGHYLGVEKVVDVLAVATKKLIEDGSEDILLRRGDFDDVYEEIKDLRFEKIYLNFSDPWPKKRHHKHRLLQAPFLSQLARTVTPGACIHFETDDVDYFESVCQTVMDHPDWQPVEVEPYIVDTFFARVTGKQGHYAVFKQLTNGL